MLAVIVALILWWGPTPATRKPLLALILIVLLALGAEALRRQIVREHPDASLQAAGERIRAAGTSVAGWARARGTEGAGAIRDTRRTRAQPRLLRPGRGQRSTSSSG